MKQSYELIHALERVREADDRGTLASLRRGMGQKPGSVLETSRIVEHMLDEDDPEYVRETLYIIAPLFAYHPKSESGERWRSNIGSHFRNLYGENEDPPANVERRFMALLASEPDDLPDTLRQAISLLKSKDVPINWRNLFNDVQQWIDRRQSGEEKRRQVRQSWSHSFWRLQKHTTDNISSSEHQSLV